MLGLVRSVIGAASDTVRIGSVCQYDDSTGDLGEVGLGWLFTRLGSRHSASRPCLRLASVVFLLKRGIVVVPRSPDGVCTLEVPDGPAITSRRRASPS